MIYFLLFNHSNCPCDDSNALLVQQSPVVPALDSQTHDQVLSGAVQVYWDHHLVLGGRLVGHFLPSHQHVRQGRPYFLVLLDGHNDVVLAPVSSLDPEPSCQQAFLSQLLPVVPFHSDLQLFKGPAVSLGNELACCRHVGFGKQQPTKPHSCVLVVGGSDQLVELLEASLQVDDVVGQGDGRVIREAHPRFRHRIGMDVLCQLTEQIGS